MENKPFEANCIKVRFVVTIFFTPECEQFSLAIPPPPKKGTND